MEYNTLALEDDFYPDYEFYKFVLVVVLEHRIVFVPVVISAIHHRWTKMLLHTPLFVYATQLPVSSMTWRMKCICRPSGFHWHQP